jgi:hypothetical protein
MKRYSQQQIEALLDKFMDGQTTVEEEAQLADYFRSGDVPTEWEDYRAMFDYFDSGMKGDLAPVEQPRPKLTRLMGRRWGIAAAAYITAAVVATVVLHSPTTTVPETPPIASSEAQDQATPIGETQDVASLHETEPSPETSITRPVETQDLASHSRPARPIRSTRRLQAENAKLAQENARLQRELADLKRRAFIIDLEANGFRAVQDEDGSIVLIDLEQELENELNNHLNNQTTTNNIPAL